MTLYAVIPVKNLGVSKRRLSAVFTPQERKLLTLTMLEDVLTAVKTSVVDKVLVVGEDAQVQEIAKKHGAAYLATTKTDLNPAIEEATALCVKRGATSVLVLPADVPLISAQDINRIIQLATNDRAVVLSPSGNWGTNALYQSPPTLIPACFGPGSFLAHIREAYSRDVSVRLHFSAGLSADVDSAEDMHKLFETQNSTQCRRTLEQIMLVNKTAKEFFERKPKREKEELKTD